MKLQHICKYDSDGGKCLICGLTVTEKLNKKIEIKIFLDNRDKEMILTKDSEKIDVISRYKCQYCNEYQIVAFNSVKESNFNYCPKCGCKIITK